MYSIYRSVDVSFAHHVRGHQGACVNIHGHTWKFEVEVGASTLDREGFVVDFGRVKREVLEPVHRLLDHALAMGEETFRESSVDLERLGATLVASRVAVHGAEARALTAEGVHLHGAENRFPGGMKVTVFPFNPTSERLAEWLHGLASACLADGRVHVVEARVYETLHPVASVARFRDV